MSTAVCTFAENPPLSFLLCSKKLAFNYGNASDAWDGVFFGVGAESWVRTCFHSSLEKH